MKLFKNTAMICAAGVLSGCAASAPQPFTPAIAGSAANTAGSYSITQNSVTRALGTPDGTASGGSNLQYWNGNDGRANKGYVFENTDVIVAGTMDKTTHIATAGMSGTPYSSVLPSATASYTGEYSATFYRNSLNSVRISLGSFNTQINFGSGVVSGSGTGSANGSLAIQGTVSGVKFNGTAQFTGDGYAGAASVPMTGGVYGAGTVAGIYQGDDVVGVFYGQ